MACFKASGNDHIGDHSWSYHQTHAWQDVFARATPEQLECFGVQPPGDPFWTQTTLKRAQVLSQTGIFLPTQMHWTVERRLIRERLIDARTQLAANR